MQSVPQLMPAGLLVTVPLPVPPFVTVSTGLFVNVAVTDRGPFICKVHVEELPEHAPLQPANVAPAVAWAVRVTPVPNSYVSVQSEPQLMPTGLLVTFPSPTTFTVSVGVRSYSICHASETAERAQSN